MTLGELAAEIDLRGFSAAERLTANLRWVMDEYQGTATDWPEFLDSIKPRPVTPDLEDRRAEIRQLMESGEMPQDVGLRILDRMA